MKDNGIKIGLPKGRMLEDSVAALKKIGVDFSSVLEGSRSLRFESADGTAEAIVIRPVDLLTYVECGAVDMGIIGYDLIKEQTRDVITALALDFGTCRLSVAGPRGRDTIEKAGLSGIRVATKYPRLASQYFKGKGSHVDIVKLYGAVELAPLFGISDLIVDLVSTGETLLTNGLEEKEVVMRSSARLVVNRASMRTRQQDVGRIIERLKRASAKAV
ncbi:MAG: ATP phosphoribosyltransferase [Deltaproteobacteria bacterium]|nr:ATP phosphoribosyltransferase [Deltaproteobacteria bacterium]MCL5276759.1 ATP phosphoribosyltransferase [Deltaproteobacteria bacterium]